MFRALSPFRVLRALKFLFVGPLVLALLFAINWMSYDGEWWVRWPALGIAFAWCLCLFRVLRAAVLVGGVTALIAWLAQRRAASR